MDARDPNWKHESSHWRLQPPASWADMFRTLPALITEPGYLLMYGYNLPEDLVDYAKQSASAQAVGEFARELMENLEGCLALPIDPEHLAFAADRIQSDDSSPGNYTFSVYRKRDGHSLFDANPFCVAVHSEIPESDVRPWCEALGIRYRRYEPQGWLKGLWLSLRGQTLN